MKPTVVADEMFPEGAGPFMELDEVWVVLKNKSTLDVVVMYELECNWLYFILQAGGSSGLLMDLAANEKDVHADFFNGTI